MSDRGVPLPGGGVVPERTTLWDTFVPPEPTPGDIREDSLARPPLGDGQGPRLPTAMEDMRAKYELGLDPAYSDTGTTEHTEETA